MACADQAMYAAKRAGGNRVLLHEPSLGAPTDVLGARGSAPDGP